MRVLINRLMTMASVTLLAVTTLTSYAADTGKDQWVLSPSESKVSYGSIKKNVVGEVNHFSRVTGGISQQGDVKVTIDLTSVETYIDIRNQRMIEHVFGKASSSAVLHAAIDMNTIEQLAVGATRTVDVNGTLQLSGRKIAIETSMVVARLGQQRLLAVTDEMIMVKTEDLGVDAGVSRLMELAKLPSITRVSPVVLRLVFDKQGVDKQAGVVSSPNAQTVGQVLTGDVAAGKRVYRQCQACHNVKETDNSYGPHLVNIIGRQAGAVSDYGYSTAIKQSDIVWDQATLAAFLSNPVSYLPGNRMPFAGIKDPQKIENLIAYLESEAK